MTEEEKLPKVAISYSWTSEEHVEWVVQLAQRLMADGVEVVFDQWDLKEGHDKHAFMEQMVTDQSIVKVLIVSDQMYADKADGRRGGVGTETLIISSEVYSQAKQEKFIPIIRERDGEGKECVPVYLRGRIYIDFCNDAEFETSMDRLLRNIYGKPDLAKPPLGKTPSYLLADAAPLPRITAPLARLRDAVSKGKPHVHALLQDYFDEFLEALEGFRITIVAHEKECDEKVVKSIGDFLPYRNSFIETMLLIAGYMDDEESQALLISFLERIAPYRDHPVHLGSYTEVSFDNYRFIIYELILYAIACLVKRRRYSTAALLMETTYSVEMQLGRGEFAQEKIGAFNIYMQSLDEFRNNRLKLNRTSVVASLIVERATDPRISARELVQADFLLFISGFFPGGSANSWYPHCAVYVKGSVELFAKATSPMGAKAIKQLLRVSSLGALVEKYREAELNGQLVRRLDRFHSLSIADALNIEVIREVARRDRL